MSNPISQHFIKKTDNEKMIKFKKLNTEAVIPTRATALSAGYDLSSLESVLIAPGKQHIFKTGIATAFPHSYVGKVESRSGLAVKYGASADLVIFDTDGQAIMAGIIDGDHRGEMGVILRNTGDKHLPVKPGDNIAQLVVYGCLMESKEVDELDETERGNNGFGSTDRKSRGQPIETAPAEGKFLAPWGGDWVVVERYTHTYPHIRDNLVIDRATGKWWSPKTWLPITN